jgi:hypothetical protein
MLANCDATLNFILHGLDATLAKQLCDAVAHPGRAFHSTVSTSECISVAKKLQADVVFCRSDRCEYQRLLEAIEHSSLQCR